MKVGYIRVSTKGQNVARQVQSLNDYGCEEIFIDKKSGKDMEREQYKKMKKFIRKNDVVVFAELDRLGRTKDDIDREWNEFISRGIDIVVIDMPILDTTKYQDDLGKLLMNMAKDLLSYMAEQDRKRILERQRQGIAIAKKEGKYKGTDKFYRPDSPNPNHRAKYYRIVQLLNEGKPISHIADDVGVSRNTIYQIKKEKR
ncbi:recombinase family protein [Virgibacillus salexigens]|uniref:recombinase family protein n=1 Tax=Virgibacillus massiliensis TaxID=1462526 RepID=UPI001370ACEC|nr:recombinase family protein [Virgibacillus massiliensis]MYL43948.1 helix-turn-helix domain-containing protein [Virgibacillus massiliensis]